MTDDLTKRLKAAREVIEERMGALGADYPRPKIAMVTGSGLGGFARTVEEDVALDYADIPGFSQGTVEGHASRWIVGRAAGTPVHVLSGRRHMYEGLPVDEIVFAVRLMAALGVKLYIVTNAAGGVADHLYAGDLMLIRDTVNLAFRNPLIGPNADELGPRFPDMSEPFNPQAQAILRQAAMAEGIDLKEGTYVVLTGPTYETRAEVDFLRRIGVHATGMSTVPEVIAARHAGVHVVGVSLITNSHVNKKPEAKTSHEEVIEEAKKAEEAFTRLFGRALPRFAELVESPAMAGTSG